MNHLLKTLDAPLEYLLTIHHWIAVSGYGPDYAEMMTLLGVSSKNAVGEMLRVLEEKLGLIEREPGISRAIWLTPDGLAKVDEVHRAVGV